MSRRDSHDSNDLMDSHDEGTAPAAQSTGGGGPGKKKKSGNTKEADRKEQNRIAQREFRQRKQAYIKELEGKVSLYEMGRDEQTDRLQKALKLLIEENQQLRSLLATVSGFIGEGIGGVLPRIGLDLPGFKDILSRTIVEDAYSALKLNPTSSNGSTASPPVASTSAQTLDVPAPPAQQAQQHFAAQPANPASFMSGAPVPVDTSFLASLLPQPDQSLSFPPPPAAPSAPYTQPLPPDYPQVARRSYGAELVVPNVRNEPLLSQLRDEQMAASVEDFFESLRRGDVTKAESFALDLVNLSADSPEMQAIQMVCYHMANKRKDPTYKLPPSLRFSITQQTVPHHPFFDGLIFPSLRDRLILLKDQYPLQELISDLSGALKIHGTDILKPEEWEISETFLRKWWYVVDQDVLDISNRWRQERGEPVLTMRCIVPSAAGPAPASSSSAPAARPGSGSGSGSGTGSGSGGSAGAPSPAVGPGGPRRASDLDGLCDFP
ncbi:hypothetical protein JCM10207_009145 [Rhodosporidiobolus poonsookiae]